MEPFELEGLIKDHLVQLPAMNRDTYSSIRCSEPLLSTSHEWELPLPDWWGQKDEVEILNSAVCLNCGVWNEGWASLKEEKDESEVTCLEKVAKECRWRSLLILLLCTLSCLTFSITHCICISRFTWISLTLKCFSELKELIVYVKDSILLFLLFFFSSSFIYFFSFKWQGMLWQSRAAVHLVISTEIQGLPAALGAVRGTAGLQWESSLCRRLRWGHGWLGS